MGKGGGENGVANMTDSQFFVSRHTARMSSNTSLMEGGKVEGGKVEGSYVITSLYFTSLNLTSLCLLSIHIVSLSLW